MITENGVKYWIDVEQGQKTGHFLDQRENRLMLKNIVKGKEVMECFCYTGSFSIIAAKYGARKVTGLDISPYAVATAQKNAIENKVDNICEFTQGDTFDALKQWLAAGKKFDVVILDPPAFTKNKNALHNALVGYKEINQKAMRLVKNGGYLITASCSQLVRPDMFEELIHDAAAEAHVRLRHIRNLKQAGDHPYMMSISETLYLKGFIVQVVYKD
jgi:23S rRNA (cytosine1962-C5)-methyltransferase